MIDVAIIGAGELGGSLAHVLARREIVRRIQEETGGFTAFFCWDYQYEKGVRLAPGENGTLTYLRTQAIGRLMLDNVDHDSAQPYTNVISLDTRREANTHARFTRADGLWRC